MWVAVRGASDLVWEGLSQEEVLFSWVPKDESLGDEGAIY